MTMRPLLAALILTVPLFAQRAGEELWFHPPGPDSDTPITLFYVTSCPPAEDDTFTFEKKDDEVILVVPPPSSCPSPPFPLRFDHRIGTLPAGTYRLAWRYRGSTEVHYQTALLNVRPAEPPAPFDIHPRVVRTNPAGMRLRISSNHEFLVVCGVPQCPGLTITVDGQPVTNIERTEDSGVSFDAPAHARGFADVVVRGDAITWTFPNAIYYFDRPEISIFERVLFPVLFNAPGAHGSNWVSEAVISNPNPWSVENYNNIEPIVCITYPCGERLSPGEYRRINGGEYPQGVALLVPRSEADNLAYSLRIRDTSRQAESFGTEIPVVREKDLVFDGPVTLLDVPLDPRYRVKVRVYAFTHSAFVSSSPTGTHTGIKVMNPETKEVKSRHFYPLILNCEPCPWYAEADLAPGATNEKVALYITTPEASYSWAFATVTNNTTQQVTIVTPAGGSGEP